MGEMADMALDRAAQEEAYLDDYCGNRMSMEDAYEMGFLDHTGRETEGVDTGWDRVTIGPIETLNDELDRELTKLSSVEHSSSQRVEPTRALNQEAIDNLSKPNPTCNCCREQMTARTGKFGKFYFCENYCENQSTVSDKYWQSIRKLK